MLWTLIESLNIKKQTNATTSNVDIIVVIDMEGKQVPFVSLYCGMFGCQAALRHGHNYGLLLNAKYMMCVIGARISLELQLPTSSSYSYKCWTNTKE